MIREYAPIGLIPAAWAMTFATMVYPKINTYWIQHMHYFMIIFLTGFTVLSWKEMKTDSVLEIWKKIIAAGIIFTGFGALSFHFTSYSIILGSLSLGYWLIAPSIGCYLSAKEISDYSEIYKIIGYNGLISLLLAISGVISNIDVVIGLSFVLPAISQTYSIIIASKLDKKSMEREKDR